jgi:hypothetical protein
MTFKCRRNPSYEGFSRLAAMRRSAVIVLSISLLLALSSCGEEDAKLLPGETAREITANLDTVNSLAAEGDCTGAESAAEQIRAQVEALSGVDPELKQALAQGASRLDEVVATCTPPEEETVESNPEVLEDTLAKPSKEEEKSREKEEKKAEEELEKEEQEEEEKEEEELEPAEEPSLPPQANGEAKGHEKGPGPGSEGESGGISPGSSAEGEGG